MIVAQSKNSPFVVNTASEFKNVTTFDNNGIWRDMFQLTSVPVLSYVVATIFSLIVVLTPNGNFFVVPLLLSASDISLSSS